MTSYAMSCACARLPARRADVDAVAFLGEAARQGAAHALFVLDQKELQCAPPEPIVARRGAAAKRFKESARLGGERHDAAVPNPQCRVALACHLCRGGDGGDVGGAPSADPSLGHGEIGSGIQGLGDGSHRVLGVRVLI